MTQSPTDPTEKPISTHDFHLIIASQRHLLLRIEDKVDALLAYVLDKPLSEHRLTAADVELMEAVNAEVAASTRRRRIAAIEKMLEHMVAAENSAVDATIGDIEKTIERNKVR
jgi:hypothetical protein